MNQEVCKKCDANNSSVCDHCEAIYALEDVQTDFDPDEPDPKTRCNGCVCAGEKK